MMRKLFSCLLALICACGGLRGGSSTDWAERPVQQSYIVRETALLQRELSLTPDQIIKVKAAMEAVVHDRATKTVQQVLQEICAPAQFAAWWQTRLAVARADARRRATAAVDEVEKTTLLSAKQRLALGAAFAEIELANWAYLSDAHTKVELQAHLDRLAAARESALEQILTPAQIERRTELAQAEIATPLPDLPALSPMLNLQSDRYAWNSPSATP